MDPIQQAIAHFNLDVASMQPVEESYSSLVRILRLRSGEQIVLKIPFNQCKLQREQHALSHLKADMPVPQVLDAWMPEDERPGALLLALLPGRIITGRVSPRMAYQLGELLARLHTHELKRYGELFDQQEPASPGWWQLRDHTYQSWLPLCAQVLAHPFIERLRLAYDHLAQSLPEPDGPCYVHFDYRPANVLVQRGQITGLIDFESTKSGSADLDFVKIKNEVWEASPETRAPFLAGYQSIRPLPEFERSLPFYTLYNAFGGIAWCVRRSKLDDPFFEENLARLKEIIKSIET
jgi:aminoglycoside phosphotransferase (APT) family kinase protein